MSDLTMLFTTLRAGLKAEGRTTVDLLVQVQGPPTPAGIKTERPPLNLVQHPQNSLNKNSLHAILFYGTRTASTTGEAFGDGSGVVRGPGPA